MANEIKYDKVFHEDSCVILTDKNGVITGINRKIEELHNITRSKIEGKLIAKVFPEIGIHLMNCLDEKKSRENFSIDIKNTSYLVNISIIYNDQHVHGAFCNFIKTTGLTALLQTLTSYKQLNRQLEAIFNLSSDGIWVLDHSGKILSMNTAAEEVEGLKAKDVLGKNINELLETGDIDQAVTPMVLKKKKKNSIISYKQKTQKTLLLTGTPVFDDSGNISFVIVNERDMTELTALRKKLETSNMLKEKIQDELSEASLKATRENPIVAESKEMISVLGVAKKLSRIEASNILILGETGTGKGLIAKHIHSNSRRNKKPLIEINCAALPENLLEAELFGYEKGAFTGARNEGKVGLFELANKGVLFLDEIGDMPIYLQTKLLKYLDDSKVTRLGGTSVRTIDCMVIAATNQDLRTLIKEKKFRSDLFYRLNTFSIKMPPLRERSVDVLELIHYYLNKYNQFYHKKTHIGSEAMERLMEYQFPGNVRELKNIIKKTVVMSDVPTLDPLIVKNLSNRGDEFFHHHTGEIGKEQISLAHELQAVEKQIIKKAMEKCSSTSQLARALNISQPTAFRKMKKYGYSL